VPRNVLGGPSAAPQQPPPDPAPGQTRKETEGVFVIRDGRVVFQPVKVGIAGERYFEVVSGLKAGDQVVTGPFDSVRQLSDGSPVTVNPPR
jgi:HlyD family secretion protein